MPQPYYYVQPCFVPTSRYFRVTDVNVTYRGSTAINDGLHFYVARGTFHDTTNPLPVPVRIAWNPIATAASLVSKQFKVPLTVDTSKSTMTQSEGLFVFIRKAAHTASEYVNVTFHIEGYYY
tara:strand:- start:81 stop:446 length:366 start_codon:yes stop_codon:yes gene_type:complete